MQAHDVPTHLQAEDRVLLGLTFPQIVAAMAVLGLAYGVWQRAAFLPEGHWRIAAAVTFAILGLAGIVVRPGGRALPAVVLDLLRFSLTPKRYGGGIAGLLRPPAEETPTKAQGQTKGKGKAKAKRNKKRWLRAGLPFRLLSFTLAVSVVVASVAPSAVVMAAAPPEDAQRLFIESWTVRGNRAELRVRAATSLTVQVRAQTEDGGESFRARDVLYRGERQTYSVPLRESHRAIAISWNDALGNAGLRVLDRRSFPFPIAPLETSDCTVVLEEIGWKEGQVAGRISGACESEAEEVVEAVVLTDPDDPTKSVEQRLLLDATVEEVTGSLRLAASGPETNASRQMDFVRDGEMDFSIPVPLRSGVYDASLRADLLSTHVIPLPARVDLTHHEEGTWLANVPVIGRFVGFFHTVTSTLSAVWDPVYHTVSTHLSAFFGPVTRTLSATLQAAWDPVTETVGGWVSATVGTWLTGTVGSWLSATVGTMLSATVGSWLSATVGSWLFATVGSWLSTTVGSWLSATVGTMLSTTVGTWLSATVGTWLSATVGTWLTGTVGTWLSATVGTWLTGTVGTWLSATVGTWLTGTVGTWVSTTVGAVLSATVGTVVSAVVGGFYTTVSHWVNIILGWLNLNVWVPSEEASGYASDTASKYASGSATGYASGSATGYASGSATGYASDTATGYASGSATGYASGSATGYASGSATGYASGSATGYASGSATGYASGSATGYASGSATGYASDTATGYAEDTATGYASDTATGYASGEATAYASDTATGYASGSATGYASTQVTLPGRTEQATVSETVTQPGQTVEQTVSETVEIPGRTAEREVSEDVWIEGIEVEREVEVEVVIPAYTSAEVTETEPLVREYRESAYGKFAFLSDAPYEPLPDPPEGSEVPSEAAQYVLLLEEEDDDGGEDTNPYREALDRFSGFDLHPDEALTLYSALYVAWLDSLTISLEAREVMEERAGGVVSETEYSMEDIPGEAVDTQELFRELVGEELR